MTRISCICCSCCLFLTSRHKQAVYQRCLTPLTLLMHSESCCDEAIRSESPMWEGWVGGMFTSRPWLGYFIMYTCPHTSNGHNEKRAWLCPCVTVPTDSVTPKRLYKAYLNKPK